jgi:tRNA-specific adenosine deaminase 1
MRCLPASKIHLANGHCLHDWHAEIVALRAFNHYLLEECNSLTSSSSSLSFVRRRAQEELTAENYQPFAIQDNVQIYMYCSEAPCGDASMELIMAAQDDATPWDMPEVNPGKSLTGRGYFSQLGVVRRKPARSDAPQTLSKSCSDKIAMKQCTSVLSSVTSTLIHPGNAYIYKLILPVSQHVPVAIRRAFGPAGRMASLAESDTVRAWRGGYAFKPFQVIETGLEFEFSRRGSTASSDSAGSNITAIWTPQFMEVLIGGSVQGNKQFSHQGSSVISKYNMWKLACSMSHNLTPNTTGLYVDRGSYADLKASHLFEHRQEVKRLVRQEALQNWTRNVGGEAFGLISE